MGVVRASQLALFQKNHQIPETDKLNFLTTCPWLKGQYRNKLWRHSLHALSSYPSKLRPQIAYFFIDYLSQPGETVLDPLAGSGTVALQACLMGRRGIGSDLSLYAYLLIRAKTDPPSKRKILERVKEIQANLVLPDQIEIPEAVTAFFHPRTLREILAFRNALNPKDKVDDFILAAICGILHGGRPGFLSRRTRDIIPIKPQGEAIYRAVAPRLIAKIERVFSDPLPMHFVRGEAHLGDSRHLDFLPNNSVDLVVTSPPFFETTEFVRHNWLRLWFLGWDEKMQEDVAKHFIGEKMSNLDHFVCDLHQVFSECARCLRPGGLMVIHGGKKSEDENMSQIICEFAKNEGHDVLTMIDERVDHSRKHAIRKISGKSHEFVILRVNK